MSYSSDERDAAVSGLVQGTLSFPVDRLGVRDQPAPFEEVRELTNSAFLYDPDAVFYIINQAAKALGNTVQAEVTICTDLLNAVDDLAMPYKPINDVSSLSDAATSLSVMQGALERKGVIGPSEYGRYNAAIGRAAEDIGRTARMTYVPRGSTQVVKDVVRSSSEAKNEVLSLFQSLKSEHENLIERIGYILSSYDQFLSANIAGAVGQRQLSRACSEMRQLHSDLNVLTPSQRTATARRSLLQVLANRSVVRALRDRVLPGAARVSQESGAPAQYRLSPYGIGTPARVGGEISAPWAIQGSHSDRLRGNYNGTVVDVDLVDGTLSGISGVQQAIVYGFAEGNFAIHGDIATPYDLYSNVEPFNVPADPSGKGVFQVVVDGVFYECQLTAGAGRTAAQIRSDLTTPGNWLSPGVPPLSFPAAGAVVKIVYNNPTPPVSYSEREVEVVNGYLAVSTPPNSMWPWVVDDPSGPVTEDRSFGWNANNELWIHPNDYDDFITNPIVVTLPDGSFPDFLITPAQVKAAIDAAATVSSEEFEGIVNGSRIAVASTWQRVVNGTTVDGGEGSIITIRSAGIRDLSDPTGRSGYGTPSFLGIRTLGFSDGQYSRESDVSGQAVIKALNQSTSFAAQVRSSLIKQSYFESTEGIWSASGSLRKLQSSDPTTGWPVASKLKVAIKAGENRGIYGLVSYTWTNMGGSDYLVLILDRRMRSEEPTISQHFEVYSEFIQLESLVDTTASKIDLEDPVTIPPTTARKVLGLSQSPYYGSVNEMFIEWNDPETGWKPFNAHSRKIKVGDKVRSNGVEITTVSSVSDVESGLIRVDPEVSDPVSYSAFSIESADYLAYQEFIDSLETWWAAFPYKENLDSLDRLINTVLRSQPNNDRVSSVYNAVSDLRNELTGVDSVDELIQSFSVREVPAASSATRALADRGLDRARELLLQGRFEEFFGTTSRTASHGGAFLDAATTAVVQDLNENNAARARFSAVYKRRAGDWTEDVDPSTNFTDTEEDLPEDVLEEYWPGVDEEVQSEH